MPKYKYYHEKTDISCCLKYILFIANGTVWVTGMCIVAVGIWSWNEKDMFKNLAKFNFIALDPAFILICTGFIMFLIGFTGSVGALRENTCLLAIFAFLLFVLLLLEISLCALTFILKDKGWIKDQATIGLQSFIKHYREDPDQQNLIDWIQEDWLQCCGIEGPKDWDSNNYFNCSSDSIGSREACGVPFSCCRQRPHELIKNKQCGYDVRKDVYNTDISKIIYDKGCVQAGEQWIEHNLIMISTTFIVLLFIQIISICLAQNLRGDILSQTPIGTDKYHYNMYCQ